MTEYYNEPQVEASEVLPKSANYKKLVEDLKELSDYFKPTSGELIPQRKLKMVAELIVEVAEEAMEVMRYAGRKKIDLEAFKKYIRAQLKEAIEPLLDENAKIEDPSNPTEELEIGVSSLRLYSFVDVLLSLYELMTSEQLAYLESKTGPSRITTPTLVFSESVRDKYQELLNLDAVRLIPTLQNYVANLPNVVPKLIQIDLTDPDSSQLTEQHPELRATGEDILRKARLTIIELNGLKMLMEAENPEDIKFEWLIGSNPNFLENLVDKVGNFEGNPPTLNVTKDLEKIIIHMRDRLNTLLEEQKIENERAALAGSLGGISMPANVFEPYSLTETKARELLDVADFILSIDNDPTFLSWKKYVGEVMLHGTYPEGEYLEDFLIRVKAKITAGEDLTEEEKRDLNTAIRKLKEIEANIGNIRYG